MTAPATRTRRLPLAGDGVLVPLVTGELRAYRNFDYAASAPALQVVADAMNAMTPWYSSVHRGAGFKSQVSTAAYEGAREVVREFVNAPADHEVIITRNTTDSMNLLASALPDGARVITFLNEHHANLLPWRRSTVTHLPVPPDPGELLASLKKALRSGPSGATTLVAVSGASNVTGELWPIAQIATVAHEHGARVLVDAAQLAPHAQLDMIALDVDYLALSGHKLYAPYGAGVLVGRRDWLEARAPFLRGGGAVDLVTSASVLWAPLPDRQEAGSPNVLGAVAMGVAMETLKAYGMDRIANDESVLHRRLLDRVLGIPGLHWYTAWEPGHPRVGLMAFNLEGIDYGLLAAILSAEYGIGVRHGCFCAHPLMLYLMGVDRAEADRIGLEIQAGDRRRVPGAVRVSLGLSTTAEDVDYLADALQSIASSGAVWDYRRTGLTAEYEPVADPRAWPSLPLRLARHGPAGLGEAS